MALLKNIKYANGTETNYHKIGEIRIVPLPDQITYVEVEQEEVVVDGEIETVVTETEQEAPQPEEVLENTDTTEPQEEEEEKGEFPFPYVPEEEKHYEEKVLKTVSIMVQILSYVSQEIREAGMNNNLTGQIKYFTLSMDELVKEDIMSVCYGLVKTLPDFEEAEDI